MPDLATHLALVVPVVANTATIASAHLSALHTTTSTTVPAVTSSGGAGSLIEHFVLALAVVFGAILLLRYWLLRSGRVTGSPSSSGGRVGPPMAIVGRQPLGKGLSIVVTRVGDKDFLLGVTPQSINLLTEVDATVDLDVDFDQLPTVDGSESQWTALTTRGAPSSARAVPAWMAKLDELRERTVRHN